MDKKNEKLLVQQLIALLRQDSLRMSLLSAVASHTQAEFYIAAGFVRNMVWDHLHNYQRSTPLNDIDVIYFDREVDGKEQDIHSTHILNQNLPKHNWSVKNQARMHIRNGDNPYHSVADAMSYWPEKETAVAVRLNKATNDIEVIAPFGLESLFAGQITANPKRALDTFNQRVTSKFWLKTWPDLTLSY